MTVNKRKKSSRQHGHKTHGWGAKKKHRGKGHQGGAGMAGTGKRSDAKKPSIWTDKHYFGKHGFISKSTTERIISININDLELHINNYIALELVKNENGTFLVDLEKLGFNKLLGSGRVSSKFRITAPYASKSAIEKVKKAGGEVKVTITAAEVVENKK